MRKNKIIAIVGAYGKMGKILCEKIKSNFEIIEITENNSLYDYKNIDMVIDFSSASQSVRSAIYCKEFKIPLIIGATGQTETQRNEIIEASKFIPIMMSGNYSYGILVIKKLIELIGNYFKTIKSDITIIEKHHSEKKDSPSGTALILSEEIEQKLNIKPVILSERGGKEIGEHKIDIYFENELISISHKAFSRECFADGVIKCIDRMLNINKNGIFKFEI